MATELTGQLNQHFRTQAEDSRTAMTKSRQQAEQGGAASDPAFTAAAALTDRGEAALRSQKFAEATRSFLEARDGYDRARRAAVAKREQEADQQRTAELARQQQNVATPPPLPIIEARATPMPTPVAIATPRLTAPPTLAPTPAPITVPDIPRRALQPGKTANSSANVRGFEGTINPDFVGEMQFDHPAQLGAGENFSIKVFVANTGRKRMRLKTIQVATRINRQNGTIPARLLKGDIDVGARVQVTEFSGTMPTDVTSWIVTVTVTGDKGDRTSNRLVLAR